MKSDFVKIAGYGAASAIALGFVALTTVRTHAADNVSGVTLTEAAREHRSRLDFDGKPSPGRHWISCWLLLVTPGFC